MPARPRVVAFDVIGTTFALEPLRSELVRLGFPAHALELWFCRALRDAFALAATGSFSPLRLLFETTLDDLASANSVKLGEKQKQELLACFSELPAHRDAAEAFGILKNAGMRIFALSNGAAATTESLLERAGLTRFVDRVISVDDIRTFKPRREIYQHAVELAGVAPAELALVATHAWDVHGAKSAGLTAAFVARGQIYPSTMAVPDVIGEELRHVARQLVT